MNKNVFIIAEAGVNHNGSLDLAYKLVDHALEAGVDAVKFQTFKAEALVSRVRLVLDGSGPTLPYNRLRVVDATGRELPARMEVAADGARRSRRFDAEETGCARNSPGTLECCTVKRSEDRAPVLAVLVDDSAAIYPVRIDPTFSDADWISMGGIRGASGPVNVVTADGSGNLYIGGSFSFVGDANASCVAKWNGTNWSALGGGLNGTVYSLAVSGSDVYDGGRFHKSNQ